MGILLGNNKSYSLSYVDKGPRVGGTSLYGSGRHLSHYSEEVKICEFSKR